MRPESLTLHNFGPFFGTVGPLSLDRQGLVGVFGNNTIDPGFSSNNVGKSMLAVDGLMWTAWGETSPRPETTSTDSGLKGDEVVNERAGAECKGVFDFVGVDGIEYRVTRWRGFEKPNKAGVQLLDRATGKPVADLDAPNVQEQIDRALGMDYETARRLLVRSQEDSYSFAQATPKQRHDLLTQVEGLDDLDVWAKRLKDKADDANLSVRQAQAMVKSATETLDFVKKRVAQMEEQRSKWSVERGARVVQAEAALIQHDVRTRTVQSSAERVPELRAQIEQLSAEEAAFATPPKPDDLVKWEEHSATCHTAVHVALAAHNAAFHHLTLMRTRKTGFCTACGQDVPASHIAEHVAAAEQATRVAGEEAESARVKAAKVQATASEARTAWDAHVRTLAASRQEIAVRRGERMALLRQAEQAQAQLPGHHSERARLAAIVEREENARDPFDEQITRDHQAAVDSATSIQEWTAKEQAAGTEQGLLRWWLDAIPSMKAWLFDAAVAEITTEANRWLAVLTQGSVFVSVEASATTKAGAVRDKVALRCFHRQPSGDVREQDFRRWSGGSKRRIALAIEWALAARLQRRAKTRCSLLILDEVDRHLDGAGREVLLDALRQLAAEKETLIVISHDSEVALAVDKRWTVSKTIQGTTVECT